MFTSRRVLTAIALAAALTLGACSGGSGGDAEKQLAAAADVLANAEAIDFSISTTALPSGEKGLLSAEGTANHSPAFQGEVKAVAGGITIGAEVIATDGKVWAKTGFSPVFMSLDPERLGAPDPASLVGTKDNPGITGWISSTVEAKVDGKSRDGKDVYTKITGTIPGKEVAALLPSAAADSDFQVVYRLNSDGELHDMKVTGAFYGSDVDDVTYTLKAKPLSDPVAIEAP